MKLKVELMLIVILCLTAFTVLAPKPSQGYVMNEYVLSHAAYGVDPRPTNIILGGYYGADWGVYAYFTMPGAGRIGRINVKNLATVTVETWAMPSDSILGASEPWDIANVTTNSAEYIFYTDYHLGWIGKLTPSNPGSVEYWGIPTEAPGPRGIDVRVVDPAGKYEVWFTEYLTDKIGKLDLTVSPAKFIEYSLPAGSKPNDILVTVLDGKTNVWFTAESGGYIGLLTESPADTGKGKALIKKYPVGGNPHSLAIDPDGVVWFTRTDGMIGELNPWSGEVILHGGIPTSNSQPTGIAIDNHTREVWFTESTGHRVAKYIPGDNLFIEYPTLTAGSTPTGIIVQRPKFVDSGLKVLQVYFTEWSAGRIGLLEEGGPPETYGGTTTNTVTWVTSAVTAQRARLATTNITNIGDLVNAEKDSKPVEREDYILGGTSTTKTTVTATTYRLSTSTAGQSTSYIVYAEHTTTTSTSTSTSYVATVSETSTYRSTSVSTSYIATTSITYSFTSYPTVYTATQSLTSTTRISVPDTLTTTLISTKYKKTTSATTSVTETLTAVEQRTATQTVTATATIPVGTTTATLTQTTVFTTLNLTIIPCLIASAAYGSELDPAVQYLRGFRDNTVKATYAGSRFMDVFNAWYYSFSPTVARRVAEFPVAKAAVKAYLTPLFPILQASAATYHMFQFNPEFAVTLAGILASTLIGLVYDTPLAMLAQYAAWRKWRFKLKPKHLTPLIYAWAAALAGIAIAEVAQSSLLMEASTAVLVLASMAGSALLTSTLIMGRVLGSHGPRRRLF